MGKMSELQQTIDSLRSAAALICDAVDTLEELFGGTGPSEEETAAKKAQEIADWSKRADFYRDKVLSIMADLRTVVDEMENLTAEEYWPMPTYGDLLFGVI